MRILKLLTLVSCLACLSGCFAMKFKGIDPVPQISTNWEARLSTVTIGIEKKKVQKPLENSMLENLAMRLKSAGIFKDVVLIEDSPSISVKPDVLLIKNTKDYKEDILHSCSLGFEGGMITIGTVGLIPQVCRNEITETFVLAVPKTNKEIDIQIKYETGDVMGWAALFYAFSSEWTLSHRKREAQYISEIRSGFLTGAEKIQDELK